MFLVLLLGAAMIANVIDGPMPEYRGSWGEPRITLLIVDQGQRNSAGRTTPLAKRLIAGGLPSPA
jgi:hypothetical protein